MTSQQVLTDLRQLAEKAQKAGLRNEARLLFATELVMQQQIRDTSKEPEPWANKKEIQAFVTDRMLQTKTKQAV